MFKRIARLPQAAVSELRKVFAELKRVEWISRSTAIKSTALVLFSAVLVIVTILVFDNLIFVVRTFLFDRGLV